MFTNDFSLGEGYNFALELQCYCKFYKKNIDSNLVTRKEPLA